MNTKKEIWKADCADLQIHFVPACLTFEDNQLRQISVL